MRKKPLETKQLEGDIHKERWNLNAPKPQKVAPSCPKHLSRESKAEWRRLVKELEPLGLLTKLDRGTLAAYCQAWGRWVKAENKLAEIERLSPTGMGYLFKTTNGNLIINPMLSVANKALDQMHKLGADFGMSPVARTRIDASGRQQQNDELEDIVSQAEARAMARR